MREERERGVRVTALLERVVTFEAAAVVLVAAAVAGTDFGNALASRPLVWLGKISYSLYLWHLLFWAFGWSHALLVLVLSLMIATVSYRFVEQPLRRRPQRRTALVAEPAPG